MTTLLASLLSCSHVRGSVRLLEHTAIGVNSVIVHLSHLERTLGRHLAECVEGVLVGAFVPASNSLLVVLLITHGLVRDSVLCVLVVVPAAEEVVVAHLLFRPSGQVLFGKSAQLLDVSLYLSKVRIFVLFVLF
jgi:hypothetical protein